MGDVMLDAATEYSDVKTDVLERNSLAPGKYLLLTVHRPVNTDSRENLEGILRATEGQDVVFPAHPRTVKLMESHGTKAPANVRIIKPVNYVESLALLKNCRKLLTDSGGMQKEAYFFGKPCITLREATEWVETVRCGWNILVGANPSKIRRAIETFSPSGEREGFYGDGKASERIAALL